jgi:hypothetical protein
MQPVQWSLVESETPRQQTSEPARPAASEPGQLAPSDNVQSDRQAAAESLHAAFVWLFGPGCY